MTSRLEHLAIWQLSLLSAAVGLLILHAVLGLVWILTQALFWWDDL